MSPLIGYFANDVAGLPVLLLLACELENTWRDPAGPRNGKREQEEQPSET